MDVATALTVAQTLFATLQCTEVRKLCSILKYESELQKLQATIDTVKKDLLDGDSKCQELTNLGQHWVEHLKDAVYDADDLFDEFKTIAHQFEKMPGGKISKKVRRFFSSENQLIFAYNKSREIKKIREMLDTLTKNNRYFGSFSELYKPVMSREETCPYVYEQGIIGRDADKKAIEDLLLKDELEDNVSFVTIVGMGGLGKTALAQLVFNDPRVKESFDKMYWVCVSDKRICKKDILGKMIREKELNLEELHSIVRDEIKGKKYFLVLDDAWSENAHEWLDLTNLLRLGGRGSRILVTSRSEKVATAIGKYPIHKLSGLSDEDSWELFRKISLVHRVDDQHGGLVEIGKAIVRKCANVPLSIRVIAGLLRDQKIDVWESYKSIDLAEMSEEQDDIMPTLMFSYYHLTPELKTCFSFCSIFPKDYEIVKEKLISMWLAQGYLVRSCDSESEENVGEKYFSTLLHRCFFQDIGENGYCGKVTFKMHDLMHDLAQKVAKNESLVLTENKIENFDGKFIRHLSGDVMKSSLKRVLNDYRSKKSRSFFNLGYFYSVKDKHVNINVNEIIHNCRRLRVLDLEAASLFTWTLPESLGKLLHLRYLDLSRNKFEMLPESVAKLRNLQTLNLYYCICLKELPKEMSRLVNLRILDIRGCTSLSHMPGGMDKLTCLHTLPMFVMSEGDDKNGKLKELQALVNNNLGGKYFTVRHYGNSGGEFAFSRQEQLGRVFPNNHDFVTMDIGLYEGAIFPSWASEMVSTCFKGLVSICFSGCHQLEQLPSSLSQLCHLQHLELFMLNNMEYIESATPSPSAAFFPSLKSLNLYYLPKLKGWWRDVWWMENGVGGGSFVDGSNKSVTLPSFPKLCNLHFFHATCDGRMTNFPPWSSTLEKFETDSSCVFNTLFGEFVGGDTLSVLLRHTKTELGTTREGFGNCASSLLHLEIKYCKGLENLPVKHITNLKSLSLSGFDTSERLDGIAWEYLHSLTYLKISYFGQLVILPNTIQRLTSLQTLNLQCCHQFESLGKGLNFLSSLQVFQIKDCPKLKSLPQEICHLTSLTTLKIENCPELTILPEVMCHLSSLPKLEITDCPRLTSPP